MSIALIDYRAGNLTSVKKGFAAVGADLFVPASPADLKRAAGVVVPGVGHFEATRSLDAAWRDAILERVGEGRPLLGICLGMQWLYEGSEEAGDLPGLGLFNGRCARLEVSPASGLKIPHVGWNSLDICRAASLVEDVPKGAQVYFTHSYAPPVTEHTAATTTHGKAFASIVQRGHVAGVQFHPEKSGEVGLKLLRNFLALVA